MIKYLDLQLLSKWYRKGLAIQSINQGRIVGIIAALGLECGTVFHVGVAALSISTLLPASDPLSGSEG